VPRAGARVPDVPRPSALPLAGEDRRPGRSGDGGRPARRGGGPASAGL